MTITAEFIDGDGSFAPKLSILRGGGARATLFAEVNTRSVTAAMVAVRDLAPIGSIWPDAAVDGDGTLDELAVVGYGDATDIEGRYAEDLDGDPGDLSYGTCVVPVFFETPGLDGRLPPPDPTGDAYTVIETGETAQEVRFAADASIGDAPINNGQGVSVGVGTLSARIRRRYPAGSTLPVSTLVALQYPRKVNDNAFNLPPNLADGAQIAVAAGQALYRGFTAGIEDGAPYVEHVIDLAPDHLARWVRQDENGDAVSAGASPQTAKVYGETTFNVTTLFG